MLSIMFTAKAYHYYLAGCRTVEVYSDCKSLRGMFEKNISDILNTRQQRMIEKLQYYNLDITHISGINNKIADCISRLTRSIREAPHFPLSELRLASVAKSARDYAAQVETSDP